MKAWLTNCADGPSTLPAATGRPEPDQEQAAVAAADQLAAELQATGKAPCIVVMPDEQARPLPAATC